MRAASAALHMRVRGVHCGGCTPLLCSKGDRCLISMEELGAEACTLHVYNTHSLSVKTSIHWPENPKRQCSAGHCYTHYYIIANCQSALAPHLLILLVQTSVLNPMYFFNIITL